MNKLHLGCGWRNFGTTWIHVDNGDYQHLDHKTDISDLSMIEDHSIDLIYASHIIAYFDRVGIVDVLKEWNRVLKLNGTLRLATPDFTNMTTLYTKKVITLTEMLGPLYGKMPMDVDTIYHRTTYDFESLKTTLESCGFGDIEKYNWWETEHSDFDDHSQAYIPHMDKDNGTLISLNVECRKKTI